MRVDWKAKLLQSVREWDFAVFLWLASRDKYLSLADYKRYFEARREMEDEEKKR